MALSFFEEIEARGEARGEVRGKAEAVLGFLRKKFQRVPKRIENAVCRMTDPVALDSLVAYVVDCKTLDEFAEALK